MMVNICGYYNGEYMANILLIYGYYMVICGQYIMMVNICGYYNGEYVVNICG